MDRYKMPKGTEKFDGRIWPPIPENDFHYLDEASMIIPGWPGYRNRPGRSGLDPLDNEFELARMEGIFIRNLIKGRLRPNERLYRILMFVIGMFCLLLFFLPVMEQVSGGYVYPIAWCYLGIPGVLGVLLLWNLFLTTRRS
jgi:hypothetical protein